VIKGYDEAGIFAGDTLDRIIAALRFADARRQLQWRLQRIAEGWTPEPLRPVSALDVLCSSRSELDLRHLNRYGRALPFRAPFGWVWVREFDRACARLMPWWLAWPVLAWNRRWQILEPLVRVGLLECAERPWWLP